MEIVAGLQMSSIERLKQTWAEISPKRMYNDFDVNLTPPFFAPTIAVTIVSVAWSPSHCSKVRADGRTFGFLFRNWGFRLIMEKCAALVNPAKNFATLRQEISQLHPPCVPFFGMYGTPPRAGFRPRLSSRLL